MAILNRVSRLLTADLHAVIDRLEEPQAQLQQALREMHQAIDSQQAEQQQQTARMAGLTQQHQQLTEQLKTIQAELNLCLEAEQEDLARTVMRRRLQLERHVDIVHRQLADGQRHLARLNERLATQQQQLQDLSTQADLASQIAANQQPSNFDSAQHISEADIDIALLSEKNKVAKS